MQHVKFYLKKKNKFKIYKIHNYKHHLLNNGYQMQIKIKKYLILIVIHNIFKKINVIIVLK